MQAFDVTYSSGGTPVGEVASSPDMVTKAISENGRVSHVYEVRDGDGVIHRKFRLNNRQLGVDRN